nr:AraC family transcriptional regulator [Cerasicoccus arenae]
MQLSSVAHYHQPAGVHPRARAQTSGHICIELVTGGRGWVWHEDEWVEVLPGSLVWHGPGDHTIGRSEFDDPYRCLSVRIRFQGGFQRPFPRVTKWEDLDAVAQFTEQAVKLAYEESFDSQLLAERLFAELQFRAGHYAWAAGRRRAPEPLLLAQQAIERDYAKSISVEDLAKLSGWSVPHLHAEFRRYYGKPPHQALITRRIRAAKVQLAATNNPIKQIAVECGFSGASAFCTAFKRQTGVNPAVFRQERQLGAG